MVQEESLRELYEECHSRYEYLDGKLYYKQQTKNKKCPKGSEVGHLSSSGYRVTSVNYQVMLVHRIVFLMFKGYLPSVIDHIDRDKENNRIGNLREADHKTNSWNRPLQSNNKSGYRGVSWSKNAKKWRSSIKVNGKRIHLGMHTDAKTASEVYRRKVNELRRNETIVT